MTTDCYDLRQRPDGDLLPADRVIFMGGPLRVNRGGRTKWRGAIRAAGHVLGRVAGEGGGPESGQEIAI
jgi:hypothetical protein